MKLIPSQIIIFSFLLFGATEIVSDFLIYQKIIISQFTTSSNVPMVWWAAMLFPAICLGVIFGYWLREARPILLASISGALASHLYNQIAAVSELPGHLKSWAVESPLVFWSAGFATQIIFYVMLMAVGFGIHALQHRRQNAT